MGKCGNLSQIVETEPRGGGGTPFPPLHVNLPSKFWHFTMKILAFYHVNFLISQCKFWHFTMEIFVNFGIPK